MKKRLVVAVVLAQALGIPMASAATGNASGAPALALAGVVAPHSPALSSGDRRAVARLFNGTQITFPADQNISVGAASVECRTSSANIALRTCDITFQDRRHATRKVALTGRAANEVLATLAAARVPSGGDAAAPMLRVTNLACTIDPAEMRRRAGGGATCAFETGG